jgi:hypothetical protein
LFSSLHNSEGLAMVTAAIVVLNPPFLPFPKAKILGSLLHFCDFGKKLTETKIVARVNVKK